MNSLPSPEYKSRNGNGHMSYSPWDTQEAQLNLRDYIRIMYKGRFLIISLLIVVMAATVYYTFTTEPVYEASAKLMIEEKGSVGESLFDITSAMKKETMINNQVEILKSRTLAENVILRLQKSPDASRLRILGNVPREKRSGGLLSALKRRLSLFRPKESDSFQPSENERFEAMVQSLRNSIAVEPIRNTDMIQIKVSGFSAFEAAYLTNAVAAVYEQFNQEQSQAEVREVKSFLESQLSQFEKDLAGAEEALKIYQENAKVVALDQETAELVRKIAEFETLLNGAKTDMEATRQRLKYIDSQLEARQVTLDLSSISSQPYLAELKRLIAEKEAALASMMAKLVELNALDYSQKEISLREKEIEGLKEKFRQEVAKVAATDFVDPAAVSGDLIKSKIEAETELQALQPKVDALAEIVAKYNAEMESLPQKSLRLARLMRQREVSEKIYIMLNEKYQESRITEVGQLGNVRMIDPAMPPKYPVKPKKKMNLMLGFLIGLGLGVGLAFFIDHLDNSVNTMEDVEAMNLSLLATIPYIKPERENGLFDRFIEDPEARDINERLITHLKPKSPISESYRTLRTNITFSSAGKNRKTIMVTSSGPKEGKSTSISNLAITFAQMGNKTLLIDGDLRRPMLHKLFALDKQPGLTNVLVGRQDFHEAVKQLEGVPHLDVMTCGVIPPNPAELLGSERMKELLETLKDDYDVLLIDAPPIIAVTDPSILASMVDGVILVVRSAKAKRDAVQHAVEQLKRVEAPLLGVLLNGIQASNAYGSYYYYNYYHYYYGQDGEKKKKKRKSRKKDKVSY